MKDGLRGTGYFCSPWGHVVCERIATAAFITEVNQTDYYSRTVTGKAHNIRFVNSSWFINQSTSLPESLSNLQCVRVEILTRNQLLRFTPPINWVAI